jgi:hypothetical protein
MPNGSQIGVVACAICGCLATLCAITAVYSVFDDGPILFWSVAAAAIFLAGVKVRRVPQRSQTNA